METRRAHWKLFLNASSCFLIYGGILGIVSGGKLLSSILPPGYVGPYMTNVNGNTLVEHLETRCLIITTKAFE